MFRKLFILLVYTGAYYSTLEKLTFLKLARYNGDSVNYAQ